MPPTRSKDASATAQLIAAISGLLLTVAFLEGTFTPEGPKIGCASADQVRNYAADHATALRIAALAGVCVLVADNSLADYDQTAAKLLEERVLAFLDAVD